MPRSTPTRHAGRPEPNYPVRAADSVLKILLTFENRTSVRVTDVARELGVARSTAHRLLAMLVHHGLAAHDPSTRRYVPGPALWRIGLSSLGTLNIVELATPHLQWLRDETGETVHLVMLEGRQIRFVKGIEGVHGLRGGVRDGVKLPAHATSGGKYLLAHLEPEAFRTIFEDEPPEAMTPKTLVDLGELEDDFARIRRRGYAISAGESEVDLTGIAAGVWALGDRPVAAIALVAPSSRLGRGVVPRVGRLAQQAATALSEALGGAPPPRYRP